MTLTLTRDRAHALLRAAEYGHVRLQQIAPSPSEVELITGALDALRAVLDR